MKTKYLSLYYKWMTTGEIEEAPNTFLSGGLCSTELAHDKRFRLLNGQEFCHHSYWAYEYKLKKKLHDAAYKFTPLRQNIVLLMACLNNEL